MPSKLVCLTLVAALVTAFSGCANRATVKPPMMFYHSEDNDFADFIHLRNDSLPFSIEILGHGFWKSDSVFSVFLQVGTYGSPVFVKEWLHIEPDSVKAYLGDRSPQSTNADGGDWPGRPWVKSSLHVFQFPVTPQDIANDTTGWLPVFVTLNGYAVYKGDPVDFGIVRALVKLPDSNETK